MFHKVVVLLLFLEVVFYAVQAKTIKTEGSFDNGLVAVAPVETLDVSTLKYIFHYWRCKFS